MRRLRSAAGFTLVELTIVTTLIAIVAPSIYLLERTFEADSYRALAALDATDGMRAFSEELRADLRTHRSQSTKDGSLSLDGDCAIRYSVTEGVLVREQAAACGGRRALARHVDHVTHDGARVEVLFSTSVGKGAPENTRFLLALVETR